MRTDLDSIVFSLGMATVLILLVWGGMIEPRRSQERIATKALEVYRLELEAGISKKDSKALPLLEALGEANKTKEHDHGNDQR